MKKCCECKRLVWPWQQSKITFSPIHKKCHQSVIDNALVENPGMRAAYLFEVMGFEDATGIKTGLEV